MLDQEGVEEGYRDGDAVADSEGGGALEGAGVALLEGVVEGALEKTRETLTDGSAGSEKMGDLGSSPLSRCPRRPSGGGASRPRATEVRTRARERKIRMQRGQVAGIQSATTLLPFSVP